MMVSRNKAIFDNINCFLSDTPLETTKYLFTSGYQLDVASRLEMEICVYLSFQF